MFRFSVRDLLWLTLVVALVLGWFVHQRQLRDEARRAQLEAGMAEMAIAVVENERDKAMAMLQDTILAAKLDAQYLLNLLEEKKHKDD